MAEWTEQGLNLSRVNAGRAAAIDSNVSGPCPAEWVLAAGRIGLHARSLSE